MEEANQAAGSAPGLSPALVLLPEPGPRVQHVRGIPAGLPLLRERGEEEPPSLCDVSAHRRHTGLGEDARILCVSEGILIGITLVL